MGNTDKDFTVRAPQAPQGAEPPPAETLGERALQELVQRAGPAEEDGKNQGKRVIWAGKRWASTSWWTEHYPKGDVAWCAGAVCSAYQDAGSQVIGRLGSLSCSSLLENLRAAPASDVIEVPFRTEDPLPGDVLFTDRDTNGSPNHVTLIQAVEGMIGARVFRTLGGNGGKHVNAIAEHAYREEEDGPKLLAVFRILR
jgi:hypothetical protein